MSETIPVKIPSMAECEFVLRADQDHMRVRGNAMASGDDAEDRACEDEILGRLDDGDVWAWALVTVTCKYRGWSVMGRAYLGGCTYRDEEDFRKGGCYEEMEREAYEDFIQTLERMGKRTGLGLATVLMGQQFMEDMA